MGTDLARRALARPDSLTLAPRVARSLARFDSAKNFNQPLSNWNTSSVTEMSYMWVLNSPAVRAPAPTRSRPRSLRASLARSLARQVQRRQEVQSGPQRLGHEFGEVHKVDVGTDLARRARARPDALTLAPRVARSLARFSRASAFNQDLSGWVVNNVNDCDNFCYRAGFNPTSRIPSFQKCGKTGC